MENAGDLIHSNPTIKNLLIFRSKNGCRILVLLFFSLGFALPAVYGYLNGFPVPHIHDEFSYLLAADTFAAGRLTNPTPPAWENFESPHILLKPTYMSKYPPMQGLFLAAGQIFFGHPAFGVWLSCGLAAAALFWMLSVWSQPLWAVLGTVLMIFFIGIDSYWAQSYWGGMVAAAGGALFLGGFRSVFKEPSYASTILMTLGGVILVNSRPFEGLAMMIPALFVLLYWTLVQSAISLSQKVSQVILPGVFIMCLALSAMAYYNYRITGNAFRFPYAEHQAQYFSTPLFIFQDPIKSESGGHVRLQRLYKYLDQFDFIKDFEIFTASDNSYLIPIYAFVCLLLNLPYLLLMPPLMVFFYIALFPLMLRSQWEKFIVITLAFTFFCMSFATYWDKPHYAAPLVCCFYLLIVQGFRLFISSAKNSYQIKLTLALLVFLTLNSVVYQKFFLAAWFLPVWSAIKTKDFSDVKLDLAQSNILSTPKSTTQLKPFIEAAINKSSQRYLIIVSYHDDFTYQNDDIVYNEADVENSKVVWAHDLGENKNRTLIDNYKNRQILLVKISNSQFEIIPQ